VVSAVITDMGTVTGVWVWILIQPAATGSLVLWFKGSLGDGKSTLFWSQDGLVMFLCKTGSLDCSSLQEISWLLWQKWESTLEAGGFVDGIAGARCSIGRQSS